MHEAQAKKILVELQRRTKKPINVLESAFDKQLAAILDPAKMKSISCTRRAAKSYTSGLYLYHVAMQIPHCNVLYIGLTRDSAKRIMWKDVLREINDKHKLNAKMNISELSIMVSNGSMIYLLGADSDEKQKSKVLGQKFALVIVDEAASYTINLRDLVFGVLKPAVADYRGTICLTGTAGNLVKGLFYDVTTGKEPGWSKHSWTTFDNPFMAEQWGEEIEELKAANPLIVETALFKQMYLNQWVVDSDKLVYKFNSSRNLISSLPLVRGDHRYILGVDLGYNDETAFVVSLYSKLDPNLYFIKTLKKAQLDLTQVARIIKELDAEYNFDTKIVDGSNKQAVAELNNRHGLNLIPSDKTGKSDFIEIFNAELVLGRIKLVESGCQSLIEEWASLIWDDKTLIRREHPNCPNHICFVAGTKIQTPNGEISIENLKVGDLVETRKGSRRINYAINRKAKVIKLQMCDGSTVTCTPDHPFWSIDKWISAQDLTPTDQLFTWNQLQNNTPIPLHVLSIIDITEKQKVYNLTVEDQHEYFANGILVSNCDASLYNWRYTYTYLSKVPEEKAKEFSPQWYKDKEKEMLTRVEDKYEKAKREKEWDVWQTEDEDGWGDVAI